MPFTVRIAHQAKSFLVGEDETILDAALRQDFDIAHSCCEGICGSCEGQVIDGFITYAETEHLILDEAERAAGKALFCSAKACSDLLIDIPGIGIPQRDVQQNYAYQLVSLERITHDVYQACLLPQSQALPYLPGQYVELHLSSQEPKPFSIANAPDKTGKLELYIRCQNGNQYAKELIAHLKQEKTLMLRGPYGRCFYHSQPKLPSIFIAVGTGFAPIKAILEATFLEDSKHEISLFWAGKITDDLYQMSLPKAWAERYSNFRFIPILLSDNRDINWPGVYGNILDIVLDYCPRLESHHIYFGGPPQLTFDALEKFVPHGAQTCYMYSDVFDLT